MLRKSFDRGIPEWRGRRGVLVVILQCERVFGTYQVIEIGYCLVGDEISRLRYEGIFREVKGWRERRIRRRYHVLAVRQLVVQHGVSDRIDVECPGCARRIRSY